MGGRGRRYGIEQRQTIIGLIDEAVLAGARVHKACAVVGINATTVKRWRTNSESADARKGPLSKPDNALSKREEEQVLDVMNTPEYSSLSPDKLVALLATLGIYVASESTMYRILRRNKLLAARGRAKSRRNYRPKELRARGPRQVWAWDITFLPTTIRGRFFKLYLVLDIWSRFIVGAAVHEVEDDALAAQLLESCYKEQLVEASTLTLHSDNGGAMKGSTMLAKLQQLGVMPSFSRPSVSDDNPYPEALNRTLKYHPGYPQKPFASLDEAQQWVATFVRWYNTEHLHSGISFVTPEQRHYGQDQAILKHRRKVYAAAKARRPDRWTGRVRKWPWIREVVLNPAGERGKKNA